MIKGLIINASILISFLVIGGQCSREKELSINATYTIRVLGGILAGIFGSTLIVFGIIVTPTFILDFRQLAIVVVAIYGGWVSAIVAGFIIGLVRLLYMGINHMAVIGAITAQILAIGCSLISMLHIKERNKWIGMVVYSLIVSLIVYAISIKDLSLLTNILLFYTVGFSILSVLVCYYSEYIIMSNRLVKKLREESTKDFLTGLNNVRNFDKLYNNIVQNVKERNEQLSVLTIDIDFFKKVNDVYGHQAGDEVLKELASLLTKTCRSFDIISRNGGEEFSVILIDCPYSKAYDIGERIRIAVEEHKFKLPDETYINITVSIGVATYPDMASNKETLIKLSDKALYKAKNTGRNKVC